jgi:hypothetical protein
MAQGQERGMSMSADRSIKSTGMVNFVGPTPDPAFQILVQNRILQSWKEIAGYMKLGVRTVQRYEDRFHLPIHRAGGKHRSAVLALSDEIDEWVRNTPVRCVLRISSVRLKEESTSAKSD